MRKTIPTVRADHLESEVNRLRRMIGQLEQRQARARTGIETYWGRTRAHGGTIYPSEGHVAPIVFVDHEGTEMLATTQRFAWALNGDIPEEGTDVQLFSNGRQWFFLMVAPGETPTISGAPVAVQEANDSSWSGPQIYSNYYPICGREIPPLPLTERGIWSGVFDFPQVHIAAGEVITYAYIRAVLTHRAYTAPPFSSELELTVRGDLYGCDEDSPADLTSIADWNSRPRTTAAIVLDDSDWMSNNGNPFNTLDNWENPCVTPDVTAILNELVSRPGWVSGNRMMLFLDESGSPNPRPPSPLYRIANWYTMNTYSLVVGRVGLPELEVTPGFPGISQIDY